MKIDVRKPEGNVFYILGIFKKHLVGPLKEAGCDVSQHEELLRNATSMTYDNILDRINELSNDSIKFVGRKK